MRLKQHKRSGTNFETLHWRLGICLFRVDWATPTKGLAPLKLDPPLALEESRASGGGIILSQSVWYILRLGAEAREKNGPKGRRWWAGATPRLLVAQEQVDRQTVLGAWHRSRRGYCMHATRIYLEFIFGARLHNCLFAVRFYCCWLVKLG